MLSSGTAVAESTGDRVDAILTDVGWPFAKRTISIGQATLDADFVGENVKALDYLNKVSLSEPGALFVGATGNLVFRDRADLQDATRAVTFGTGGIPFSDIVVEFGVEEMANKIAVTYYGGTAVAGTAVATDTDSITAYGVFDANYAT